MNQDSENCWFVLLLYISQPLYEVILIQMAYPILVVITDCWSVMEIQIFFVWDITVLTCFNKKIRQVVTCVKKKMGNILNFYSFNN